MNTPFEQLHQDLADLANDVTPVDLRDRAIATSRKIGMRRALATTTAAALVLVASAGVAYAIMPQKHAATPERPTPTVTLVEPSPTPSSVAPTPTKSSVTPSTPTSSSQSTTLVVDARTKKIVDAAITIPAWPGYSPQCPGRVAHFSKGVATASPATDDPTTYHLRYEAGGPGFVGRVLYANLDGHSADEALITVTCVGDGSLNPEELLALRLMPDGTVRTLGFVIAATAHRELDFDSLTVQVNGRTVMIEVEGEHTSNGGPLQVKQLRGYEYVSGAFQQVSGPTTFPPVPTDIRNVDMRNTTIAFGQPDCSPGCVDVSSVRVVDGIGTQSSIVKKDGTYRLVSVTFQVEQSVHATDRSGANIVLLRVAESGNGSPTKTAVYAVGLTGNGNGWVMANDVVDAGQDGITQIVKVAGGPNLAKVTVETASGQHVDNYAQDVNGNWGRAT